MKEENQLRILNEHRNQRRYGLFVAAFVMVAVRISFANFVGSWMDAPTLHDDQWFFTTSQLRSYYANALGLGTRMLIKEMIFSYFLCFVRFSGMSFATAVSILWVIGSGLAAYLFHMLTKKKAASFLAFTYFLWCPIAFEFRSGTRMYRQTIMAPMALIAFCSAFILLFMLIFHMNYRIRHFCLASVLVGASVFVTAYIKEDGIWLLLCLATVTVLYVLICIFQFRRDKKKCASMVCISLVPLLLFGCLKTAYTLVNYKAFGVYATNTRTDSAIGEFINYVYKIDSDDRTEVTWAPKDAIEKAFAASPTLSEHPDLLDAIIHTPWFSGDIEQNPIRGDFLGWVLRDALASCGLWTSYADIEAFFEVVNLELDEAFKNGELQKSTKFQLVSSTGGRSTEEILSLLPKVGYLYKSTLLLFDYIPGSVIMEPEKAKDLEYEEYVSNTTLYYEDMYSKRLSETQTANGIIERIFKAYKIMNCVLAVLSIGGITIFLVSSIRKKRRFFCNECWYLASAIATLAISFAYAFAVCWFCEFLGDEATTLYWQRLYGSTVVPIVYLTFLFGAALLIRVLKKEERIEKKGVLNNGHNCGPDSLLQ